MKKTFYIIANFCEQGSAFKLQYRVKIFIYVKLQFW